MTAAAGGRTAREACAHQLADLMRADDRVVCLDSDTGAFARVDFGPAAARYLNLGIAEQNMMGVAAGLARTGLIPFVHTMATFAATRALEAVKVDLAYAGLPVHIVASHAGLSAASLGPTHHALEDVAIMRMLPGMRVAVPADTDAALALLRRAPALDGPSYLRLGRDATPPLPGGKGPVRWGSCRVLRPLGGEVLIVACGPRPVCAALAAADTLAAAGAGVTVLDMHTVKPLDTATLSRAARAARVVVTVEEHWMSGGLGSAVAEWLSATDPRPVRRIGAPDRFFTLIGDHAHLLEQAGITAEAVVAAARSTLVTSDR
ncbi:transketolase C-terminal domain-containing protein [Plantactinospora sp. B6F1]|uniref:transketolase family protein n=1 Tax=Plantactinospora sp. B6F1 TaxID=3158971 RepID=UPI0010EFEAEA